MIAFRISGEPVACARSRGNGPPELQRDFRGLVQLAAAEAMGDAPLMQGPLEMIVRVDYLRPASWSKKKAAETVWRTSRPDADDLAKLVSDALNGIAFADDAQIASLIVQKRYSDLTGVTVSVARLEGDS